MLKTDACKETYDTRPTGDDRFDDISSFLLTGVTPGLLVCHAPLDAAPTDRCLITQKLSVGRSSDCDFVVLDGKMSSRHFCIVSDGDECLLEDLGSTNGTYLNGYPVRGRTPLAGQSIIRAGSSVFVFHLNAGAMMLSSPLKRFGMDGRFHSPLLVRRLEEAALSGRNLLLSGDTGTGKELAARAFAELMGTPNAPLSLFIFNAARFASREEAASTLFGVAPRFFSGVDARMGLIEQAHGGVLFIDELHNLPIEHQRMLLRVMEDGQVARLGESTLRRVEVRFILASNAGGDTCGLASDLFARLRRVSIPPLNARIADIPQLFCALFRRTLERRGLNADEAISRLTADHMEALCLMDFSAGNVRILVDLADRLTTRIMVVTHVKEAISAVFGEQFETSIIARRQKAASGDKDLSRYEQHKDLIIATHRKNRKNLSQTERDLKSAGVGCSRRWLRVFLKKWGEKN